MPDRILIDTGRGLHGDHPPGRRIPDPLVREMLRALGIVTCPTCHQVRRIIGKRRTVEP